jgi:hypothetical protein
MTQRITIDSERDGQEVRGLAEWRVLEHFDRQADESVLECVKQRLPIALKDFPALVQKAVDVGILSESAHAQAQAFSYNRLICLSSDEHTTNITLCHELGHIAARV